ncbi:hypothetical protein [Qipengyuania sphaerica]|uniref:hypothetical protein n=1 Tax=Qipengyuania sphaerica TaxID=2867243 RepID=UPI001C883834|nr:hypothetical protein [Qipengyuania sphaerica]MBX7540828.1 hypothetical protein [Qipengyuania sphaerica]
MKTTRLLSGIGAIAMAIAPVAAQAGTRASDATVSVQPVKMSSVSRASQAADQKSEMAGGAGLIIAILAAAAVIVGIIIAVDGDDDIRSTGV